MKKFLLTTSVLVCVLASNAQVPEDVLRYSYFPQQGSARNSAIGGAMGSLGGDISALFVNPAGLGFYKTKELVLTPGVVLNNNKFNFRGTNSTANKSGFDLGTSGIVLGFNTPHSKWANQALSIGINQTANFNNITSYKGRNNSSSYTEMFAEEVSGSGLSLNDIYNNPRFAFGTSPALFSYIVDTFRNAQNELQVKGLPEFLLEKGIALDQQKTVTTKGGIYDVALGYASNLEDKLYLGAGIGISFVNYDRNTFYRESDPSGDKNNNFDFFELTDNLSTKGAGINAKLGLIYKPKEFIRLGVALHTPTFYSLTDKQSSKITANTEAYNNNRTTTELSSQFTGGPDGETQYTASTPWKAMVSGSYVFREISDTRKQRAFVTADIEYVGYPTARFNENSQNAGSDKPYYDALKAVIKDYYKGAVNYRLGGELKFNTWMFRAGGAYYSNPYKVGNANVEDKKDLPKANRFIASGGLGYRNYGMFIDLTYAHTFNRDVNFPYRLQDKANTFAHQTGSIGNVRLTVGFKL